MRLPLSSPRFPAQWESSLLLSPYRRLWWHHACGRTRSPLHIVVFENAPQHTSRQTPYHKPHQSLRAHPSATREFHSSHIHFPLSFQYCWSTEDCQIPCMSMYHLPPSDYPTSIADVRAASPWACHTRLRLWEDWSRSCGPSVCEVWYGMQNICRKTYVCLFVSLAFKAVHLELVSDLTTQAFITTLRRFIARRGYSSLIWSDHSSNFIGANCELRELHELLAH